MNKKAMSEKTLITVLIFIVAFLVVGFIGLKIIDVLTSKGDTESCRLSVLIADKSPLDVTLSCSRNQIVLYPDYYTINGDKEKYSSTDYTENVKKVFAEEMRQCWYKLGEGELDPFTASLMTLDQVCFICSHISFENAPVTEIGNLHEFLQDTKIPTSVTSLTDTTYYESMYDEMTVPIYSFPNTSSKIISAFNEIITLMGLPSDSKLITNIWIYTPDKLMNTGNIDSTYDYDVFYYGYVPRPKIDLATLQKAEEEDYAVGMYYSDALKETCEYLYS